MTPTEMRQQGNFITGISASVNSDPKYASASAMDRMLLTVQIGIIAQGWYTAAEIVEAINDK